MNCPKCGTPNPNGAPFCSACGNPLPAPAPQPQQYAQPQFQQPVSSQFQQPAQPQFQQPVPPQFQQPGAQYNRPYQPMMRRPSAVGGFDPVLVKTRMNLLGLIGAIIFLLCIFMPVFETAMQNIHSSYTVVGASSLSSMSTAVKNIGGGSAANGLFKDSGKYIAMFVIDIVISVGAMVISAAGIDIGVVICGGCAFVIGLLTMIFSAADIGSFYKLFTDRGVSADTLSKQGIYFGIGIAPILMIVSSILIISGGVYGFLRKIRRR